MKTWIKNAIVAMAGVLAAPFAAHAETTFTKDVAPIMFNHCTACHRDSEVAPFPLTSYAEAKKHAKQLAKVTHTRQMPPVESRTRLRRF